MALRPNVMFGEEDPHFVPGSYKSAVAGGGEGKESKGFLRYVAVLISTIYQLNCVLFSCSGTIRRFGECTSQFQQMYVGNAAWAHIVAAEAMRQNPQEVGGQAYFITDDSPTQNIFEMMKPYLKFHDLNVSDRKAPILGGLPTHLHI